MSLDLISSSNKSTLKPNVKYLNTAVVKPRRKRKIKEKFVCLVCEDECAAHKHFSQRTCNSCKFWFDRIKWFCRVTVASTTTAFVPACLPLNN